MLQDKIVEGSSQYLYKIVECTKCKGAEVVYKSDTCNLKW